MSEKKIDKKALILSSMVCLIPVLAGIILYAKLPDTIATHWDSTGAVNGTSSKFVGIIVFPGILLAVNLLMQPIMRMDPKYANMGEKMKLCVQWIFPVVSIVCSGTTLSHALGIDIPVQMIAPMLCGLIFIVVGNYLPKTQQSYTLGIKLPWTLHSEDNWNKTHRMAGYVWVICGFCMIIASLLPYRRITFPTIVACMVLIPTVYSYLYYRKKNEGGTR